MSERGDSHRQQALFGEEIEFTEKRKRKTRSTKKSVKPKADLVIESKLKPVPESEFQTLETQKIVPETSVDDWQEVQISLAQEPEKSESENKLMDVLRPAKKQRWWLKLTATIALLIISLEGVILANEIWNQQSWLSALYGVLFVLIVGGLLFITLKELRKLSQLADAEHKQEIVAQLKEGAPCEDIDRFCKSLLPRSVHPELTEAVQEWQELLDDSHSDLDVLALYEKSVLQICDQKATEVIQKWSAQAAVMVAVSPLVTLDMLLIAWRNIRMIDEVAACYGIELGLLSRIKLMKLVIYNLIYAGGSEMVLDLGLQSLGADLAGKFSARAAQGIGAGLLTARLGIKSMQLARPMAFSTPEMQPKLGLIMKGIRQSLLQKVFHSRSKET